MSESLSVPASTPPGFVVGIGASAGGLDSLERFFRALPAQPGVAIVIVQHLSPNHESLMEELLGRFTAVPIHRAEDGLTIASNQIYVLPPGKEIILGAGGVLSVTDRPTDRALSFPVDRFFTSLAAECERKAIAVVLSGSGSDGSRGLQRVHEAGGLVLVEDPSSAAFDGMPRAAIDTGMIDAVLPPADLAHAVIDHVSSGEIPDADTGHLIELILELLKEVRGVELADYKPGTIYRRLTRRVNARHVESLAKYLEILQHDRAELEALHDDLFIGVTSFFRDPIAFAAIEQELLTIAQSPIEPDRPIRIWVAGCATGEEAYSYAILCEEILARTQSRRKYKIFATDAHRKALEKAGAGVYRADQLANISAERLRTFFTSVSDTGYKINEHIRHAIVFAQHNVLVDTPFTNLDIVSCRNMLIYFRPKAQRRALASLSYGLRLGGVLVLGSSEHPSEFAQYFDAVHEGARIYRKRMQARSMRRPDMVVRRPAAAPSDDWRQRDQGLLSAYDILLDKFMPRAFLLTEARRLVDSYAGADTLLQIARRRPSFDFLDLVPAAVRTPVAAALARAVRESTPATYANVTWPMADGSHNRFDISAERVQARGQDTLYLLTLTETERAFQPPAPDNAGDGGSGERMMGLERELQDARQSLQSTIEELEASNEELQATNEELQASNEELQSVNEELHSVNEELHTVNAEHQLKIAELTELNRDVGHLLESIDVATVFLDNELRIRKFTPRARELFGVVEHDIGRLLSTFAHRLQYPRFNQDVAQVHQGGPRVETEVSDDDNRWYLVRILPYRTGTIVNGVVVTVTDATALALERAQARRLSAIVDSAADAIIGQNSDGVITTWNVGAERLYGYTADEMVGQSIMTLVPDSEQVQMRRMLADVTRGGDIVNVSVIRRSKAGDLLDISKTMSPVRDSHGTIIGVATIDRDARAQRDLERRLRESERKYADLYNNAPDSYLAVDMATGRILECNDTFTRATGYSKEEARGLYLVELCTDESRAAMRDCLQDVKDDRPVNDRAVSMRRKDGGPLEMTASATPAFDPAGIVVRARMVLRDVASTRRAERQVQEAAKMREQFLAMASHELRGPLHAVTSALQITDSAEATPDQRERSRTIVRRQIRQMVRLVDDLLDVSRITHGKLALERSPIDLAKVLRGSLDALAGAYQAKGVRLLSEDLEHPIPLVGDAGRLEQVFTNLLENALRASGPDQRVTIRASRSTDNVEVHVVDEGKGIAPDQLQTIFGMFAQSAQGIARTEGGLGLGLTIADRIVAAHGGTLTAHSDGQGMGATFTVSLPFDPGVALSKPRTRTRSEVFTVAVIEDQDDAREMILTILRMHGHEAFGAADGQAGVELVVEQRPAVAFVDIGLPVMSGYEVATELRKRLGQDVRLVALSGYGQPEDVKRARDAGFDRHVTKPVDPDRLIDIMRGVVLGDDPDE